MEMSSQELSLIFGLVKERTGIQMNESKKALLMNRLSKRVSALGLGSYAEYYRYLTQSPGAGEETSRFIDAVTTNETFFFRAPKLWDFFASKYLPERYRASPDSEVKLWCAASSSGEEPYTIAMICEEFAKSHPKFCWSLEASDISNDILGKAHAGVYDARSLEQLPPRFLKIWFDPVGEAGKFAVKEALKKKVRFFRHKLQDPPPGKDYDVIFVRNVFIYFDLPTKEAIVGKFRSILKDEGMLIIGESESLVNVKNDFKYISPSIYRKEGRPS